ncbi:MAG: hypothetical protein ACU836_14675 [Gammaproteobacteria bacterium]
MNSKNLISILLAVSLPGGFTPLANAGDSAPQCSALYRTPSGQIADASFSANRYSEEHIGAVGISIFPSIRKENFDPHADGLKLLSLFTKNDIEAACFVNHSPSRHASLISYKINGLAWREGNSNLTVDEALDDRTVRAVVTEAKMVRDMFNKEHR